MKHLIKLFVFFLFVQFAKAQSVEKVYQAKEIAWLGINFTKAKMVGDFGPDGVGKTMRDNFFVSWNDLILNEKGKYNLAKAFNKDKIIYSIKTTAALNAAVSDDSIMKYTGTKVPKIDLTQLKAIATQYAQNDKSGYAALLVVEKFDKGEELAVIDLVFLERQTGELLFAKRITKGPGGLGIRNYWAKTIYEVLDEAEKSWLVWRSEDKKASAR